MAMWIGGWFVVLVLAAAERGESSQVRATLFGLVARAHTVVMVPGALLTLGSGIVWSMAIVGAGDVQARVAPLGVGVMTAAGFVGGLLIAFVALPSAVQLKAVAFPTADGKMLPVFERQRKRLIAASTVAGVLAVVSLFASVLAP
jgi:hypothetical protein